MPVVIIGVYLCMPGQAVLAAVDLVRLAVLIEGRQVYAPDGSGGSDTAARVARLRGPRLLTATSVPAPVFRGS